MFLCSLFAIVLVVSTFQGLYVVDMARRKPTPFHKKDFDPKRKHGQA